LLDEQLNSWNELKGKHPASLAKQELMPPAFIHHFWHQSCRIFAKLLFQKKNDQ
jgi:hypothetical protein